VSGSATAGAQFNEVHEIDGRSTSC
jgi:hypothetical protein